MLRRRRKFNAGIVLINILKNLVYIPDTAKFTYLCPSKFLKKVDWGQKGTRIIIPGIDVLNTNNKDKFLFS